MTKHSDQTDDTQQPSFEAALAELETIVHALEDGQLGLAESLGQYERGVKLMRQCYVLLEGAERRIELLSGLDAQGNPVTQPLADTSSLTLDEKVQQRSHRRSAKSTGPVEGELGASAECPDVDTPPWSG
jgi:exodeoxyribonuclease VII small subunit